MTPQHDPMGAAIADYHKNGRADRLRVLSPDFDEDEMPVDMLFRHYDAMSPLEQQALDHCRGRVLDIGAGAGCHALVLQDRGLDVTAIDISPLSVETMKARGVCHAIEQDFWTMQGRFDTLLMLMNGIGIVGTVSRLPRFFAHIKTLLAPGGSLIFDSTDIRYLFEDEDGHFDLPTNHYYGELTYRMQYRQVKGRSFPWLYINFATLADAAHAAGFQATLLAHGDHFDYLAEIRAAE
ncbi:MAG: class I SAM-dependent methyltransferase [Alloprevotella sp.]